MSSSLATTAPHNLHLPRLEVLKPGLAHSMAKLLEFPWNPSEQTFGYVAEADINSFWHLLPKADDVPGEDIGARRDVRQFYQLLAHKIDFF